MIEIIKRFLKSTFLFKYYDSYRRRERRISNGNDNPDKTYYVIGPSDPQGGLFWLINIVLMHISYAEKKGYIPIVDMKNNITQYLDPSLLHKENAWEYFFQQPCGITLNDISSSKNIILSKKDACPNSDHFMGNFYDNEIWINHFRDLFSRYIKPQPHILQNLESSYKSILGGKRVVGVLCRGTDYITKKPTGHPIPPTPKQVIEKTKEIQKSYNCNYVFLATEDEDIFNTFLNEFGEYLLYNTQDRIRRADVRSGEYLSTARLRNGGTVDYRKRNGLQYYEAIYILSKCNCFISARCGGAKGVLLMNNGFEYKYIFNLGMYK